MMRLNYKSGSAFLLFAFFISGCLHPVRAFQQSDSMATKRTGREAKQPTLNLTPCHIPGLTEELRCGKLEVYEDRAAKSGRQIGLNIVVMPAISDKAQPDPVFLVAGGPGQSAISAFPVGRKDLIAKLRRERDVVLVDQRGTGGSNPLACVPPDDKKTMQAYFDDDGRANLLRACKPELEKKANLKLYTTDIAMDDLDDVRSALGYERINIQGGSYGSQASLVYLRRHPEHVRTVELEGVVPPDYKLPLRIARGVQHALDRLFEDCNADKDCKEAFPNLKDEFEAVLAKLDKGPAVAQGFNVFTKKQEPVSLTRFAFLDTIRHLLYAPEWTSVAPLLIHFAYQGDYGDIATAAFQIGGAIEGQIARGMSSSVLCAEDIPFITEQDILEQTAGTYLGDSMIRSRIKGCADWPRANVPASFLAPVKSNVPVLILSGDFDPVAPYWLGDAVAAHLPASRHVIIRYGAHTTRSECTDTIVANFVSKGSAKDLDTSCVNQMKRPPFRIKP